MEKKADTGKKQDVLMKKTNESWFSTFPHLIMLSTLSSMSANVSDKTLYNILEGTLFCLQSLF